MQFCKLPIMIDAFQLPAECALHAGTEPPPPWLVEGVLSGIVFAEQGNDHALIKTLEGTHRADVGDWIIRGVKGELYPCKPDIFELTYTPVLPPELTCVSSGVPAPPASVRTLSGHQVNPANDVLRIDVMDAPGAGGAHHRYLISGFDTTSNPSNPLAELPMPMACYHGQEVLFQNGPIGAAGVNGITHEALLAILIDRLECFQAGAFHSYYNEQALAALRTAQEALHARTKERMARNVEGTHQL